jgi:hypothetical protein
MSKHRKRDRGLLTDADLTSLLYDDNLTAKQREAIQELLSHTVSLESVPDPIEVKAVSCD